MKKWIVLLAMLVIISLVLTGCDALTITPSTQNASNNSQTPTPTPTISGEISVASNYYIVFDGSGSMEETNNAKGFISKFFAAKWAISKFVTDVLPSAANIGLYAFDASGSSERVHLGTGNKDTILKTIDGLRSGNNTPLNNAIMVAANALNNQKQKQLGYGYYYIIVITDGQATDDANGDVKNGVNYALKYQIPIITIGYGINNTHALAKYSIAYRNATDPNSLFLALKETHGESDYFDSTTFNK